MTDYNFDSIRPYHQNELPAALKRIVNDDQFNRLLTYLFPSEKHDDLKDKILNAKNTNQLQLAFMLPVIRSILAKTAGELSLSGIKNYNENTGCVFIANHRDIILDSYILSLYLVENGFNASQITWGNNLMVSPLAIDLGKANKMITVYRDGSPKEMFKNSQTLSAYIRQTVAEQKQTVWIAQRKGRAKDGTDTTDIGVLKMLSLTGGKDFIKSLGDLNITPVTISYEWEPCDAMKVRELLMSNGNEYVKEKNEDFLSIIGGVVSQKGRIHLNIGTPLNDWLEDVNTEQRPNEVLKDIGLFIDKQIHQNYMLWPSNYLAFDLLNNSTKYSKEYDSEIIEKFNERLKNAIDHTNGDKEKIKELFLKLYANPVKNKINAIGDLTDY
jgi:hypothetical protein